MEKNATVRPGAGTLEDVERLYCEAVAVRGQLKEALAGLRYVDGLELWKRAKIKKADSLARLAQERLTLGTNIRASETLAGVRNLINAAKRHATAVGPHIPAATKGANLAKEKAFRRRLFRIKKKQPELRNCDELIAD